MIDIINMTMNENSSSSLVLWFCLCFFFHIITFPFSLSHTHSLFALITHPRFGPLGATKGRPMPTIPQKTVNTITGTMPIFLQDIIYTDLDSNRTQKQSNETSKRSQGDDTNRFFLVCLFYGKYETSNHMTRFVDSLRVHAIWWCRVSVWWKLSVDGGIHAIILSLFFIAHIEL